VGNILKMTLSIVSSMYLRFIYLLKKSILLCVSVKMKEVNILLQAQYYTDK